MLHLFRKQLEGRSATRDGSPATPLTSHIFPKFLKRLRAREHPYILDLGPLSGANIEFFARMGCKVQVEDLHACIEPPPASVDPAVADDAPDAGRAPAPDTDAAQAPTTRPAEQTALPVTHEAGPAPGMRPQGGRPSRHIVLPPRTFRSSPAATTSAAASQAPRRPGMPGGTIARSPLPTVFSYPDETFDAVVAWDLFDYYDPESARRAAAESRRVLKPGGYLLGYFHAGRAQSPDGPRRYRILDEARVASDDPTGRPLQRHLYQNRDIEKMFTGMKIVELFFLKNSLREILMEKKVERAIEPKPLPRPSVPKPRFTIE
jgi:SAM-dependent methyltransferase